MHNESYSEQESKTHWIFALLLGIAGLLVLLIFLSVRSKATDNGANYTSSTAALDNVAPYLTSVSTSSTFTPTECSATDGTCGTGTTGDYLIHVTGNYTDPNGCAQVTGASSQQGMSLLYLATSTTNCTTYGNNGLNCVKYNNLNSGTGSTAGNCIFSSCSTVGTVDGSFDCAIPIRYNSEPAATWMAWPFLFDGTATSSYTTYTSSTFTINAVLAVGVTPTMTFKQTDGSSSLVSYSVAGGVAQSTSGTSTVSVYNTGNTAGTHFEFYGRATSTQSSPTTNVFSCTTGVITSGNLKWQLTMSSGSGDTSEPSMASSTPGSNAEWNSGNTSTLAISTSADVSTSAKQTVYFKMYVPAGVAGSCTGSLYFTAL